MKRSAMIVCCVLFVLLINSLATIGSAAPKVSFMVLVEPSLLAEPRNKAISSFTAQYGIDVELVTCASWVDMQEKFAIMAATGTAPDVVWGDSARLYFFTNNKLLRPLNDIVARDGIDLHRWPPAVIELWRFGPDLMALPTSGNNIITFYNEELFNKAGANPPPLDWESEAWDWQDYVTQMRKLTIDKDGDGRVDQWGLGRAAGLDITFLFQWGGLEWVSRDLKEWTGESEPVIKALETMFTDYLQKPFAGGDFYQATGATMQQGTQHLNRLVDPSRRQEMWDWRIGTTFKGEKGSRRISYLALLGMGISATTDNLDAAWKLVRYLTYETEGARLFSEAEQRTPLNRTSVQSFIDHWLQYLSREEIQMLIDAQLYSFVPVVDRHINGTEIMNLVRSTAPALTKGEMSPRMAMAGIGPAVKELLADK